jgi:N-acetylglucosaminyl-diphospho-decaprenol L-rhamnosyltransferase
MPLQDSALDRGKVTVSVVSHRQAALVAYLLADLKQHCSASIAKLVLTCNVPETQELDLSDYPFPIETILNKTPLGFGANHNNAFRRCESDWFLVMNPDVRLMSDVISALLGNATASTGLLAPQEVDESGRLVQNLRGLITPWELLERQVLKKERLPPAQRGWVKGMFMLTRTKAFQAIGGFDERYFMYCEDFDLCARLMLADWSVSHCPEIRVVHAWQRQSHVKSLQFRRHLLSLFAMWTSNTYWQYKRHLAMSSN